MKYKGLIWTNHLLDRMRQRGISKEYVYWTFRKPDRQKDARTPGSYKFMRSDKQNWFVVVAKKNDKGEWILMSCWSQPKKQTDKPYRSTKHLNFWQNLLKMLFG